METAKKQYVIEELAITLKSMVTAPEWASYVKTGHGKQRPPVRDDWWQIRAASILLKIQALGPVGVSKLTTKYGTIKNRGAAPEKFSKASGNIIRKILQQLESSGLIKQEAKGVHKGRIITTQGIRMINEASKKALKQEAK